MQMQCIEFEPNVADNIDGAYLEISSKTVDYYFYINTDPALAGKTGVLVYSLQQRNNQSKLLLPLKMPLMQ